METMKLRMPTARYVNAYWKRWHIANPNARISQTFPNLNLNAEQIFAAGR